MKPRIRPATPEDAALIVDLIRFAGDGIPELVWAGMAVPGQDPLELGRTRARRDEGSFSYRNARIAEIDGQPAGGWLGYRLPDPPPEIGPDFPPALRPLQELENLAPGAFYLNVLAVYPAWRNQGLGAAMLDDVAQAARASGATRIAIIAFSANPGAIRLYTRSGFAEAARRRMEMPGWDHSGTEAVLLLRPL